MLLEVNLNIQSRDCECSLCPKKIDLKKAIYVVFDLETNGLSRERNNIIEIAAQALNEDGILINDENLSFYLQTFLGSQH